MVYLAQPLNKCRCFWHQHSIHLNFTTLIYLRKSIYMSCAWDISYQLLQSALNIPTETEHYQQARYTLTFAWFDFSKDAIWPSINDSLPIMKISAAGCQVIRCAKAIPYFWDSHARVMTVLKPEHMHIQSHESLTEFFQVENVWFIGASIQCEHGQKQICCTIPASTVT